MAIKKIKNNIYNKITCPLVSAVMQLFIISAVFFYIFPDLNNEHYYRSVDEMKVKKRMSKIVNQCGQGYFVSWLILQTDKNKDKYIFKDVIGCNKDKGQECAFSVVNMNLNNFYNEQQIVDKKTRVFLEKMMTGEIKHFFNIKDVNTLPSIKTAIEAANLPIYSLTLTVVKNIEDNIVYVFTMSDTINNKSCSKKDITSSLRDLALSSRKVL